MEIVPDHDKPEATIKSVDFKMKFFYSVPVGATHVIHYNQQVIQPIKFGSQSLPNMPAQGDVHVGLPAQSRLLFRGMDYANTWEDFISTYPTITLTSENSNLRTYADTRGNQNTSSGTYHILDTSAITDVSESGNTLADSSVKTTHGNQYVNFTIVMYIYRENENIYARFEMHSISTFTDADVCEPGSSASVFIGDITLR